MALITIMFAATPPPVTPPPLSSKPAAQQQQLPLAPYIATPTHTKGLKCHSLPAPTRRAMRYGVVRGAAIKVPHCCHCRFRRRQPHPLPPRMAAARTGLIIIIIPLCIRRLVDHHVIKMIFPLPLVTISYSAAITFLARTNDANIFANEKRVFGHDCHPFA